MDARRPFFWLVTTWRPEHEAGCRSRHFRTENGMWWMNSPIREGYASSLRTKDKAKAEAKYRELLADINGPSRPRGT